MTKELTSDLDGMVEESYGGGRELSTTGYFIFGLLTFWIYTVWTYHQTLADHFRTRWEHFNAQITDLDFSPEMQHLVSDFRRKGFTVSLWVRYALIGAYFVSMALILSLTVEQYYAAEGALSLETFDLVAQISVGVAALCFSAATVIFLSWASGLLKNHEYNELLLAKLIQDPKGFKMLNPSRSFVARWNRKLTWVAFFLILSVPMTVSPFLAVREVVMGVYHDVDIANMIYIWSVILAVVTAVFHFWGTKVLLRMYNDHLRIETVNQQYLTQTSRWSTGRSDSVLNAAESADESTMETTGLGLAPVRALAALMMTDIVGFSRDMERDEAATYKKLNRHNDIIRKWLERHKGQEIKTIGDAFLVKFNSAVDAVQAAINIQTELWAYNEGKPDIEQIWVRIGVHIGDVLIIDRDVLGNGVNITSRIEPLAEPGGICISADVYNVVKKAIEIKAVNLGRRELKNIKDAPEIYKVLIDTAEKRE